MQSNDSTTGYGFKETSQSATTNPVSSYKYQYSPTESESSVQRVLPPLPVADYPNYGHTDTQYSAVTTRTPLLSAHSALESQPFPQYGHVPHINPPSLASRSQHEQFGSTSYRYSQDQANVPPPSPRSESPFHVIVRQQPVNARACGFGERDRRVIDPPPIVEMLPHATASTSSSHSSSNKRSRYPMNGVVHCTLWHAHLELDDTAMPESGERRQQRRLMGSLVSSPFIGVDETGREGCFFTFPDLSVRTAGNYRLRFVLIVLHSNDMGPGYKAPFQCMTTSEVFTVFPAKDFPGMKRSTPLTKALKEQGCLISVKKGSDVADKNGKLQDNSSDEADSMFSEDDTLDSGRIKRKPSRSKKTKKKKKRTA